MDLATFRDNLVTSLMAGLPANVKVKAHPGRFDLAELNRYMVEAPAVFVTLLEAADLDLAELYDMVDCAAYILTKTGKAGLSDKQMLTLGTGLKAYIRSYPIGGADASSAMKVKLRNLYSSPIGEEGVALGAVTWSQKVELDQPDTSSLEDFLKFYGTFDIGQSVDSPAAVAHADLPATS